MPDIEKPSRPLAPIGAKSATEELPAAQAETPQTATPPTEDGVMDADAYERLLDMYDVSFKNFAEGEVVKGTVLQVSESEVIVDVGYKSEGIIAIDEFRGEDGKIAVKAGDVVEIGRASCRE